MSIGKQKVPVFGEISISMKFVKISSLNVFWKVQKAEIMEMKIGAIFVK